MKFEFLLPANEANVVLRDSFYVKFNKHYTATVRHLQSLIDALNEHETDENFGVIVKEANKEELKESGKQNFFYYLIQIIGAYKQMAVFNNNKHTFIELDEDRHTISIKTSKGKLLTFAIMDYADCVDIALHNSDVVEPMNNGSKDIPQFEVIGFNCGATPIKKTAVTVLTVLTK